MFEISDETRNAAIIAMKDIILEHEPDVQVSDEVLGEAFDAAVVCVKRQFGM